MLAFKWKCFHVCYSATLFMPVHCLHLNCVCTDLLLNMIWMKRDHHRTTKDLILFGWWSALSSDTDMVVCVMLKRVYRTQSCWFFFFVCFFKHTSMSVLVWTTTQKYQAKGISVVTNWPLKKGRSWLSRWSENNFTLHVRSEMHKS